MSTAKFKQELILFLGNYPRTVSYFGVNFLKNIIIHYKTCAYKSLNKKYLPLAHLIIVSYWAEHKAFFVELESMLNFYYSQEHLKNYILYPNVRNKLKSPLESDFQSKWSELVYAFHLAKNGHTILKIGQSKGETFEAVDILTDKGSFEIATVLSDKDRYETGQVFFGDNRIIEESKEVIDRKIGYKKKQNTASTIVIDCTFMDDYTDKLFTSKILNLPVNFNVFDIPNKNVTTFIRHNVTAQVGLTHHFS